MIKSKYTNKPKQKLDNSCEPEFTIAIPEGDNRPRTICKNCGKIFYENPKIVSGCLLVWKNKILMCRRAIEPREGYWTLPAGFLENNETVSEGALRETYEEAGATWMSRFMGAYEKIVWINPTPQETWEYSTSVAMTQELVEGRMFPLTIRGLEEGMNLLSK